ncbi:MAG: 50S ribosomal protein L28 [Rickettsiales bacterium]|nr:50S ribosomal protein L28 [Rickettsiales bacterium]
MSRLCQITGRKTEVGMNVSHSHRRTKRAFKPNLQHLKFKSEILGREFNLRMSAAGLRTLVKHGGLDEYVMSKPISRLTPDMAAIKKAIAKKTAKKVVKAAKK